MSTVIKSGACSTSRNTGTSRNTQKPETPDKTRNTPPENPEHPPENQEHPPPQKKAWNTPQNTKKSAKSKKINK